MLASFFQSPIHFHHTGSQWTCASKQECTCPERLFRWKMNGLIHRAAPSQSKKRHEMEDIHFWVCGAIFTIYAKLLHLYSPPLQHFHCAVLSGPQSRDTFFIPWAHKSILNFFLFFFSPLFLQKRSLMGFAFWVWHHFRNITAQGS